MRVSGEPALPLIVMPPHAAVVFGGRVKLMGASAVPSAINRPPSATVRFTPGIEIDAGAGSIVKVAPLATVRSLTTV